MRKGNWVNERIEREARDPQGVPGKFMKPRQLLRELEKVIMETDDVVIGTDVGNISAVANGYT
jgi:hypothetical protein